MKVIQSQLIYFVLNFFSLSLFFSSFNLYSQDNNGEEDLITKNKIYFSLSKALKNSENVYRLDLTNQK